MTWTRGRDGERDLDTAENWPNEDARPYLRVIMPERPKVPGNAMNILGNTHKTTKSKVNIEMDPWARDMFTEVEAMTLCREATR